MRKPRQKNNDKNWKKKNQQQQPNTTKEFLDKGQQRGGGGRRQQRRQVWVRGTSVRCFINIHWTLLFFIIHINNFTFRGQIQTIHKFSIWHFQVAGCFPHRNSTVPKSVNLCILEKTWSKITNETNEKKKNKPKKTKQVEESFRSDTQAHWKCQFRWKKIILFLFNYQWQSTSLIRRWFVRTYRRGSVAYSSLFPLFHFLLYLNYATISPQINNK